MTELTADRPSKTTRGQLALVGVLSIVLVGVLAFRMFSSSHSARPVAAAEDAASTPVAKPVIPATSALRSTNALPVATSDRLPIAVDIAALRRTNPFRGIDEFAQSAPDALSPGGESTTEHQTSVAANDSEDATDDAIVLRIAEGAGNLRVSAILGSGDQRAALIGAKILRPGDLLDEQLRVVAIHNDRVEIAPVPESE